MEEEVGVLTVIAVTSLISVDGAIHRAAGPLLLQENQTHGGCRGGEAVESGGYRLPAKCEERERERERRPLFISLLIQMLSPQSDPGGKIQRSFRAPTDPAWRKCSS